MFYRVLDVPAHTVTVTGSTQVTAAAGAAALALGIITLSDASAATVDDAATLFISGAPAGGGAGPVTITRPHAILVDAGQVTVVAALVVGSNAVVTSGFELDVVGGLRFTEAPRADYALTAADSNTASFIATPTNVGGVQAGWRRINGSGGAEEYVPVWAA